MAAKRKLGIMIIESRYKVMQGVAYVLLLMAFLHPVLSTSFPGSSTAALAALVAFGAIVATIMFESHGMLAALTKKSPTTTFASFSTAAPNIESVLDEYRGRVAKPRLQVLGIVLHYQWPIVENYLARVLHDHGSKHLEGWQIQIALLDPEWPYAKELNSRFPADARGAIERMRTFVSNNEKLMRDHNWSFDVFTFQYVPHWVGMRIGDDVLYLCRSFWDNKQLRGGRNMVQMVTSGASTLEDQMLDEFREWFLYSQQKKENVGSWTV